MAKKHFGKLLTLAAIVGAAAAGVSYVLKKLPRLLIQLPPNAAMFP